MVGWIMSQNVLLMMSY